MKSYTIAYRMHSTDAEREIIVKAKNTAKAYETAVYEQIPAKHGTLPYSAWVESVTYSNGKTHAFNTCEGLAY